MQDNYHADAVAKASIKQDFAAIKFLHSDSVPETNHKKTADGFR